MSCGVGRICGLDPVLLWLWCRPTAASSDLTPSLGVSIYHRCSPEKQGKKKKKKKKVLYYFDCSEYFIAVFLKKNSDLEGRLIMKKNFFFSGQHSLKMLFLGGVSLSLPYRNGSVSGLY